MSEFDAGNKKRRVTLDEWHLEGARRYGRNVTKWRFVCPSCGMAQSAEDWRAYGAPIRDIDRRLGFSCIGNRIKAVCPTADVVDFAEPNRGLGCVYVGGGLFRLNPVEVVYGVLKDSAEPGIRETFEWADPLPEEAKPS